MKYESCSKNICVVNTARNIADMAQEGWQLVHLERITARTGTDVTESWLHGSFIRPVTARPTRLPE